MHQIWLVKYNTEDLVLVNQMVDNSGGTIIRFMEPIKRVMVIPKDGVTESQMLQALCDYNLVVTAEKSGVAERVSPIPHNE